MAVLTAAALRALLGAAMPQRKQFAKSKMRLRGTRKLAGRSNARYAATRYRPRGRKLSKRAWQAKARRMVATPRNYSTAKTTESVLPSINANELFNRLKFRSLILINKGPDINERLRDACILSGIRITCNFTNLEDKRIFVNWAVIHPKTDEQLSETEADFFRDYTNERSWNAGDSTKVGLSWNMAAINTDKFTVMKRGKFMLAPGDIDEAATDRPTYNLKDCEKDIDFYTKVGRTITFKDQGETQVPYEQIYFVYWASSSQLGAGNNIGDNGYNTRIRAICYFREPRSG